MDIPGFICESNRTPSGAGVLSFDRISGRKRADLGFSRRLLYRPSTFRGRVEGSNVVIDLPAMAGDKYTSWFCTDLGLWLIACRSGVDEDAIACCPCTLSGRACDKEKGGIGCGCRFNCESQPARKREPKWRELGVGETVSLGG